MWTLSSPTQEKINQTIQLKRSSKAGNTIIFGDKKVWNTGCDMLSALAPGLDSVAAICLKEAQFLVKKLQEV